MCNVFFFLIKAPELIKLLNDGALTYASLKLICTLITE